MPPIVQGQSFTNLLEFKEALRLWAIERNWTPHILDSDSHRVRAGCRSSPDCPFRIRANYSAKRGDAKVTTVDDVHNCESFRSNGETSHQNIKRAETGKLKFLVEAVPSLMKVTLETSIHDIVAVVEQTYGQKIPKRQAQKVKGALVTRVKGPCRHCHQMGHTRRHCSQLRASAIRPNEFSTNDGIQYSGAEHGDDTYADGGLEDTYAEGHTMDFEDGQSQQANMFHQHPIPQSKRSFTRTHQDNPAESGQNAIVVDPSLSNNTQQHYGAPTVPPRNVSTQPISSPQNALQQTRSNLDIHNRTTTQPNSDPGVSSTPQNDKALGKTAVDTRLEASRLMQQAAELMQQAANMHAEAARLTASVASV